MKRLFQSLRILLIIVGSCGIIAACAQNNAGIKNEDSAAADSAASLPAEKKTKKVSVLGDSYSTYEGWVTPDTNISWYKPVPKEGRPTDVTRVEQTWWKIFLDRNGYELERNNSYSGATVCNTGYGKNDYSDRSFVTRLTNIGNPDMILILGGGNDSYANSPLGEYVWSDWTPKQLYSYRPATAYMISELQRLHPNAEIVVIVNDDMQPEYINTMIEVSKHYGVKHFLLHDIERMSIHPDAKGMVAIADQLQEALDLK